MIKFINAVFILLYKYFPDCFFFIVNLYLIPVFELHTFCSEKDEL